MDGLVMPDRVFIIAEAGVNHNGDPALALALCNAAREAGADAVKFQTFRAEDLVVPGAQTAEYQKRQTGAEDQFAMLRALELDDAAHRAIKAHCDRIGIEFFSTPFSLAAVDMLAGLGVHRFKVPSGELTHRALIEHVARTGLPMLVSTGMATLQEARDALAWAEAARGHRDGIVFMHCTSAYPAPDASLNLRAITTMQGALGVPIGYSDHSLGEEAALAAVALGACAIEKHLTLDCTLQGPDHAASLEPAAFARMCTGIRRVESMRGDGTKARRPEEEDAATVARRSIVAAVDIAAGTRIDAAMVSFRRPADGIAPGEIDRVVGAFARVPITAGRRLQWDDLDPGTAGR